MNILSRQTLGSSRISGPTGRHQCRHVPTGNSAVHLRLRSTVTPARLGIHSAIIRPVSRGLRCNSQYSSSGEYWQQSCTEQSLEKLLEPYGVQTVATISNHPEHVDVLETLVVLASILDPEDPECLHELVEDYPELSEIPAEALFRTFDALHPLPECYEDLDAILLAARSARVLPLSHVRKVTRLAHVFYDVLNTTLPASFIRTLGPSSPFSEFCSRIRRLATLLRPHAALEAIEEHPQILDYQSEDIEHRVQMLEDVLDITPDQATKAAGKAPAVLMMTPAVMYQRMDALADRFSLTFGDMKHLFLREPRVLSQDLDVLSAKWKALTTLCIEVPTWEEEVAESRAEILVQLARCNVVMLQKLAYEVSDGIRIPGASTLKDLLYLERQYWQSRSEMPPPPPAPRKVVHDDDESDDDDE